jgi:hypothetical protein
MKSLNANFKSNLASLKKLTNSQYQQLQENMDIQKADIQHIKSDISRNRIAS